MSDHIPPEAVTNIFQRLSVNDLVRCRRVSKQWLAIIDSSQFIRSKLQSSMSTTSNAALFLQPQDKKGANLLCWRGEYASGPIEYHYDPDQVLLFGSCRGFICFTRVQPPHDLVVLNPSTGERHVVSSFLNDDEFDELEAYGFGYDEVCQSYKVVLITQPDVIDCCARIYDVGRRTFSRSISIGRELTVWINDPDNQLVGVFFGGAVHWCTMELALLGSVIKALDLASETFRRLPVPPNLQCEGKGYFNMNLGVVDSYFCVCVAYEKAGKADIWVMKEYWKGSSWRKIYTIRDSSIPKSVIPLWSNVAGRILLMYGRCRFVWCDPGRDSVVEAFSAVDGTCVAVYCVESLCKLFQVEVDDDDVEVKRKEHKAKLLVLRDQDRSSNYNDIAHYIPDIDLSKFL